MKSLRVLWDYYKSASTIYDIHSPFLFELLNFVEDSSRVYYDFETISDMYRTKKYPFSLNDVLWFYRLAIYFKHVDFETLKIPFFNHVLTLIHGNKKRSFNQKGIVTNSFYQLATEDYDVLLVFTDYEKKYLEKNFLPTFNYRICYPEKQLFIKSNSSKTFTAHAFIPYYKKPWRAGFF